MIFLFYFQLNDDLMKRLNAMEKNMVRVCFSVCSYTCIYICMYIYLFVGKKARLPDEKENMFIFVFIVIS